MSQKPLKATYINPSAVVIERPVIWGDAVTRVHDGADNEFDLPGHVSDEKALQAIRAINIIYQKGLKVGQSVHGKPEPAPLRVKLPDSFDPEADMDTPPVIELAKVIEAISLAGGVAYTQCNICSCTIDLTKSPDGWHCCDASAESHFLKGE